MKNKKLTGILIAAVIILLVCVVGTTFAYYFAVLRGQNENTISTSKATLILTEQDEGNTTVPILNEEQGPRLGSLYDFTVSLNSNGKATVEYVLYLEEAEGNTIDPSLIHISLSSDNIDNVNTVYTAKEKFCYNYNTGEIVEGSEGIGCDYTNETIAELMARYETLDDGTQLRHFEYYLEEEKWPVWGVRDELMCASYTQIYENGNWNGYGRGDGHNCAYGTINIKNVNSFVGERSYSAYQNDFLNEHDKYNAMPIISNIDINDFENIIYMSTLSVNGDYQDNNHVYHLRYWLSEEEMAKQGTAEGTVNDDGTVSVEIGEDAVFKFRIGVYAKSIQGS